MPNFNITTKPTGRSPEKKKFFGKKTEQLDMTRPKYNKVGDEKEFGELYSQISNEVSTGKHMLVFQTSGMTFRVCTNDDRHAQFVRNMFTVNEELESHIADWIILHNTEIESEPKIHVHLDRKLMLIVGTTFLGEIKKGVFSIIGFEAPLRNNFPMHCSAFTFNNTTNLMFGLSGTGKTTLSSDPDYNLISDDEVLWTKDGIEMIETGCYAKSDDLTPETHKTIFNAVKLADERKTLVVENPGAANARLSYPLDCVENAYVPQQFSHPDNIFFLTMDAEGVFPPVSKISGDTVKRFFETGYTSQMPGTEAGSDLIKKTFSPCYGSPFMPRPVKEYTDLLMKNIEKHESNVYLINTGMNSEGKRYPLEFTRKCVKDAITEGSKDMSREVLVTLEKLVREG